VVWSILFSHAVRGGQRATPLVAPGPAARPLTYKTGKHATNRSDIPGPSSDMFSRLSLLGLALASRAFADQVVYTGSVGALSAGWENWSWSCNITWYVPYMRRVVSVWLRSVIRASTSGPGGVPAAYVEAGVYAGFSLYDESSFANYAGLRFDISGAQPDLTLAIQATGDNAASPNIPLSSLSTTVTAAGWTTVTINFASMPPAGTLLGNDTWNRIAMQAGGSGTSVSTNIAAEPASSSRY
jgi:hypothetical protein